MDNLLITRIAVIPGLISYSSGFIGRNEEHSLFSTLRDQTIWEQHFVRIFGKQHPCPRLSAWYGIPEATYSYSGQDLTPRPFTPLLNSLLERVKTETDETFNSVLLNLYRDGSDAMGWHADDEPELGIHPVIASLSLGSVRRFLIKPKKSRGTSRALDLEPGSLLIMRRRCQEEYVHSVPRTKKPVGPRINLTFRQILPV